MKPHKTDLRYIEGGLGRVLSGTQILACIEALGEKKYTGKKKTSKAKKPAIPVTPKRVGV